MCISVVIGGVCCTSNVYELNILSILPAWICTSSLTTPFISPISVEVHADAVATFIFSSILTPHSVEIPAVLIPEYFKRGYKLVCKAIK